MVCMQVTFHKNDLNHQYDENDKDELDSYKQGVECWVNGNHGNHGNREMTKTTGFRGANHGFPCEGQQGPKPLKIQSNESVTLIDLKVTKNRQNQEYC